MSLGILGEIDRLHPVGRGGTGLADYPGLRPPRCTVFARRHALWQDARAAGLVIPVLHDCPNGQQAGVFYTILSVGPGVTSVRPGDVVVTNNCIARDLGGLLGDGIYSFLCDVDYVDLREYETETARHPDGSTYTVQRRMSDTERRGGGDVLAIAVDE